MGLGGEAPPPQHCGSQAGPQGSGDWTCTTDAGTSKEGESSESFAFRHGNDGFLSTGMRLKVFRAALWTSRRSAGSW